MHSSRDPQPISADDFPFCLKCFLVQNMNSTDVALVQRCINGSYSNKWYFLCDLHDLPKICEMYKKCVCVPEEHYLTKGLTVVWVYLGDMLVRWLYHTVEIMNHNISLKGNNV